MSPTEGMGKRGSKLTMIPFEIINYYSFHNKSHAMDFKFFFVCFIPPGLMSELRSVAGISVHALSLVLVLK